MLDPPSTVPSSARGSLRPLVGYQGGKRRVAGAIAERLLSLRPARVYDLGVGSGAVTMALVERGLDPRRITAVDAGPWGDFWHAMGAGTFDLDALEGFLGEATRQPAPEVKGWVEGVLARGPCTPERFLVMQAASHGASPVWHDGERWRRGDGARRYCARSYWTPGPGSRESKPRGTIFAAGAILAAARVASVRLRGLDGRRARAESVALEAGAVVYIDPPYEGSAGYGYAMDWRTIVAGHQPVFVSEGRTLDDAEFTLDLTPRKGGALHAGSLGRGREVLHGWGVGCP